MVSTAFWRPAAATNEPEVVRPITHPFTLHVADRRRPERTTRRAGSERTRLVEGITGILGRDIDYRSRLREVLKRQRALRRRVSTAGWRAYLTLEEAEFERWAYALDRVAFWAHARGRRQRGRR